jgi:hypothetical protein
MTAENMAGDLDRKTRWSLMMQKTFIRIQPKNPHHQSSTGQVF